MTSLYIHTYPYLLISILTPQPLSQRHPSTILPHFSLVSRNVLNPGRSTNYYIRVFIYLSSSIKASLRSASMVRDHRFLCFVFCFYSVPFNCQDKPLRVKYLKALLVQGSISMILNTGLHQSLHGTKAN